MATMSVQRNKIHPHKYSLWIAMGSIVMMFVAFTSAYVVKRTQANWQAFELPHIFWLSTAFILISSLTIQLAMRQFKARNLTQYKLLITITAILGFAFIICQYLGFKEMYDRNLPLDGPASASFIYVILGMHILHVLGGIVALTVIFLRAFNTKVKSYNPVPIEIVATYWHFVDGLWIYLLIFLTLAR
ncbi:cytochrome oxidase subunit III [Chitinophaga caeni]|uniref:Cytochrome oxidase subunit III n=1 Tax=Chitinophaga caeni TaxID=2029983 RepID=A0A291QR28_9BACT|nr:heme-copper oxidase subunit III [Chitinophaga caeni]ATL46371.1 cytochrome oxidase subunit III [Chitinophaga caeni]